MVEDVPDYEKRRRFHQRALVRQLPRGGRSTRLVAPLMAAAAEKKYYADPSVAEVEYSNVPGPRPPLPCLDTDEVRDMYVGLIRAFSRHPNGYATDLSGLRRQFRDLLNASSVHTAASDLAGAAPIH